MIDEIIKHEYVLIQGSDNAITGIVTTADLSEQFRELGGPFLLLSEVENHIRSLIASSRFNKKDLESSRDPDGRSRDISSVADLTFGEYIRLLEAPESWKKTGLALDRAMFIRELHEVRRIRNDVMHFHPDGVAPNDLTRLRTFSAMLEDLRALKGAVGDPR